MEKVIRKFYSVKNYLKEKEYEMVKSYFNHLGYKYTSIILNNNVFHFATEALIMTLSKQLKLQFHLEYPLSKKVVTESIEEGEFISNFELLLGNSEVNEEFQLNPKTIASIYLKYFNIEKQHLNDEESISLLMFEDLLRKVVNLVMNDVLGEKELNHYNAYQEVKNKPDLKFEEYLTCYVERLPKDKSNSNSYTDLTTLTGSFKLSTLSVKNPAEIYFYYASTDFNEFIKDLISFNHQCSSIIYVIISFIKVRYLYGKEKLKALYTFTLASLSQTKTYIHDSFNEIVKTQLDNINHLSKNVNNKVSSLKTWVSDSYVLCDTFLKDKYPTIHEKLIYITDNYTFPMYQSLLKNTTVIYNYAAATLESSYLKVQVLCGEGKSRALILKKKIEDAVLEAYGVSKEKIKEYVEFLKSEKEKYSNHWIVKVVLDKAALSKEKYEELVSKIYAYIQEFNLIEVRNKAEEYYKNTSEKILSSYYKFLNMDEKVIYENESEERERLLTNTNTTQDQDSN